MSNFDYLSLQVINCPVCDSNQFTIITMRSDKGRIVRCIRCKHVYLNPPLSQEMLDEIYFKHYLTTEDSDAWISQVDTWFSDPKGPYQAAFNWLLQHAGLTSKKILEIGYGTGRFLVECAKYGAEVEGIDASPRAVELAKQYYGMDIMGGYFESIEKSMLLKEASYDMVILFEIIEHVYKPYEFIKKISKFLKHNGLLIISTPNFIFFRLRGLRHSEFMNRLEHLHFFEPEELTRILKESGFEILLLNTMPSLKYEDKIKYVLTHFNVINSLWNKVRVNNFAYNIKNLLIALVNRIEPKKDKLHLSGQIILCIAKKLS